MGQQKTNLLDLNRHDLSEFCKRLGETTYRAEQLLKWIHHFGHTNFSKMSNLSKAFRQKLSDQAVITLPEIMTHQCSQDGTEKWLLKLNCGNCIETVFIPEENRGTLCVSSQVGCALKCSFCATGLQGFKRHLSSGEIIAQLWIATQTLSQHTEPRRISNVVMMGMGEPLLNFDAVVSAMDIMLDDCAYGLSKYRVTLSTSGILPGLKKLAHASPVSVAISLHAPSNDLRDMLIPINKKYPLEDLLAVCRDYFHKQPRRKIVFEYIMLQNINDSLAQARLLVKRLHGIRCKVNLIPFNPVTGIPYRAPSSEHIAEFRKILISSGIPTTVRKTRGEDIAAACGQLVGQLHKHNMHTHQTTQSAE
jgi:23S rRNA (adenine2503-C2)-methyltransferase